MRVGALGLVCVTLVATAAASPSSRRPAPVLTGVTLSGKTASLAKLRGKPVFVNVWSSW